MRGALEAVLDAGFIYWGLFIVAGATVTGYVAWLYIHERSK